MNITVVTNLNEVQNFETSFVTLLILVQKSKTNKRREQKQKQNKIKQRKTETKKENFTLT